MPAALASYGALALLTALAVSAAIVDLRRMIIPDAITLALGLSGFCAALLQPAGQFLESGLGLLAGAGIVFALRIAHRRLRGIDGLGLGDVKFVGAAGAWTGLDGLPAFLLVAAVGGLAYVGLRALLRRPVAGDERIPFAPFLAAGLIAVAVVQLAAIPSAGDLLLPP